MPQHCRTIEILSQDWSEHELHTDVISAAFDLAKVAHAFGNNLPEQIMGIRWGLSVPHMDYLRPRIEEAWVGYQNGDYSGELSPELVELFIGVDNGEIAPDELDFAARVLQRYVRLLEAAGRATD